MTAKAHNELLATYRRKRPRLVRFPDRGHIHPWKTFAEWDDEKKMWCARTHPGFVNGLDPRVPGVEVPDEDFDRAVDPEEAKTREATLIDGAAMPLHGFRDGFAGMSKAAALYFATRGAEPKKSNLSYVVAGEKIAIAETGMIPEAKPWRAVAACDLYLAQARPSLRGTVDIVDATGIAGQIAQYGATYETSALELYGTRARLQQAPTFPSKGADPSALDILKGVPGDDGEDRLPVCTVFLLSPEQKAATESAGEPDGSWSPHIQHHLFWNVLYAAKYEPPKVAPAPIRLTTGLFLADTLGNQILSPINDLASKVITAMQSRNPEGTFYTV